MGKVGDLPTYKWSHFLILEGIMQMESQCVALWLGIVLLGCGCLFLGGGMVAVAYCAYWHGKMEATYAS